MAGSGKLSFITEGSTKLAVPDSRNAKGPASKASVFYNPAMRTNRDITVLFGRIVAEEGWRYLDALGGTGAKGIRLAVESDVDLEVLVNDISPDAFATIKENITANRLDGVRAANLEFSALLSEGGYDWIDIDPYGSPVKFMDLAIQRLSRGGILSITATDTAPLCGAKPEACMRRYMARPMRTSCAHEFGLRILVGNAVRRAAAFDIALEPVFSYYHGHYFRSYLRASKGAGAADSALGCLGHVSWDAESGYLVHDFQPLAGEYAGPLWTSGLWEPGIAADMLAACDAAMAKETLSILRRMADELALPPYFYHVDDMARKARANPVRNSRILEMLRDSGFKASGVHYNPKGFKTNAGLWELAEIFNNASR